MKINNLFQSAYVRRLILAYVIDEIGPLNTVALAEKLGWSKSTVKTNIAGISDLGILVEFVGSPRSGGYKLVSWGPISKSWIRQHYVEISEALSDFSSSPGSEENV
ncbi:TPA: helix-turn-helix domain-containing protein [Shewanella algae]|uniref:helix-turn-helix domain-containing protein n=1 Tax=Shewanella TaxID=22 RepID=UPI00142F524C|nr:helix-turn-helix domain-containing protein [Shewanella sp. Iso12]HDS1208440.1 helix-turn-helix domain-containing protein [Shewanella algae]